MGIEEDQDRWAQKIVEASRAAQATQPDTLVFCLVGKEIQELLLSLAEQSERDAESLSLPKNVTVIRRARRPVPQGLHPPGFPEPPSSEEMDARYEAIRQEQIDVLRTNAKSYRFLAAHIEEERFFRLNTHDLAFLGLVPQQMAHLPRIPFSSSGHG
jgi:hypothetical protein